MKKTAQLFKIESLLFLRDFYGFFFTFLFPSFMLLIFGSIYGNDPSPYFNNQGSMDVSVPAYCAMIMGVTGLMAFPLTLASCKENKIYKRFDATPAGKGLLIVTQIGVHFFMTILGFLVLLIAGKLLYQIKIEGNGAVIFGALLLSISSIFSLGFFFTAIARDSKISNLLCYLSYFIMLFLSGATIPKEFFPETVVAVSRFLPLTYVVELLQKTFRGETFLEYRTDIFFLLGLLIICTGAGAFLYRRQNWI